MKKMIKGLIPLLMVFSLSACSNSSHSSTKESSTEAKTEASASKQENQSSTNLKAVAWYQTSAEAKALYLQAYNDAKPQLQKFVQENNTGKTPAIVLDLDETVLDNSPYQAYTMLKHKSFPEGWNEWVKAAQAKPVWGAKTFLDYANKLGVQIFYVSDRDVSQLKDTQKNLEKDGIPQAEPSHILLHDKSMKNKDSRRQQVAKKYHLVMLFGDNLLDFATPKKDTIQAREDFVKTHAKDFGTRYIILPNPMYGSWESSIYNHSYDFGTGVKLNEQQKVQTMEKAVEYFDPESNTVKQN